MKRSRWLGLAGLILIAPVLADDVTIADASREAFSQPMSGLSETELAAFMRGRTLFRQAWVVSPAQDIAAGLGPLYNRLSCIACHAKNGRGQPPETPADRMQSMLVRLSVPGVGPHGGPNPHPAYGDQFNEEGVPGVPGEGRVNLRWDEKVVVLADGTKVSLRQPRLVFTELAYGPLDGALTSPRIAQPVYGSGLLDAVSESTLFALVAETKPDGVKGRVNWVWNAAKGGIALGRLGWKANMPDLRQQSAGAMIGDLGITSPLFPKQNCTPAQTACQQAALGPQPELSTAQLNDLVAYQAHLAVPARRDTESPAVKAGEARFAQMGCAVCHRPTLHTDAKAADPLLAGREIHPYSDLLLHDMGTGLSDGRPDFMASGQEWRTPPLWGIGLAGKINGKVFFLHDGRARNYEEAILWHGGEARVARDRFAKLGASDRMALQAFLDSL
ncbi:MAG: di-heme oxidoredictase family protein [Parasulfuritortus sp.]|jgi:CxxC motif-containing protein (DUF1111 family)|nr:di-heme oxidoredictase family protein [Parasulfuritortus sp.]